MMTGASPVLVPREDPVGKIVFAVVAMIFGITFFVALMMLLAAVFRGQTDRCKTILQETPYRALLVGIVGYGVLGGLAWYFYSNAFIKRLLENEIIPGMLGAAIAFAAIIDLVTLAGTFGTFAAVGDRLEKLNGKPMSGLSKMGLGTVVSALAGLFPIIGWAFVTPALCLMAFGATVLAMLPKRVRE